VQLGAGGQQRDSLQLAGRCPSQLAAGEDRMTITNYQDLIAWQKAMDLVVLLYRLTAGFPQEERFGLTAQMRRAAVSIPSNIAEGQGRRSDGIFKQHLSIAHGSIRELETQTLLSGRLQLLAQPQVDELMSALSEVGKLVNGLWNSLR
jgi:four helix bundle protein